MSTHAQFTVSVEKPGPVAGSPSFSVEEPEPVAGSPSLSVPAGVPPEAHSPLAVTGGVTTLLLAGLLLVAAGIRLARSAAPAQVRRPGEPFHHSNRTTSIPTTQEENRDGHP